MRWDEGGMKHPRIQLMIWLYAILQISSTYYLGKNKHKNALKRIAEGWRKSFGSDQCVGMMHYQLPLDGNLE